MVVYAVATSGMAIEGPDGVAVGAPSVGTLFIAGIVPGLILAFLLGLTTFYRAWRRGYPRQPRASWRQLIATAHCRK